MSKHIVHPPSSTWPSDQGVDAGHVIGDSDEVIAHADDPAHVLLSKLFGPSIPRTIVEQDMTVTVRKSVDLVARLEGCP